MFQKSTISPQRVSVFAPLSNFPWDGDEFRVPGLLKIVKREAVLQRAECVKLLTNLHKEDQKKLDTASHWLTFEQLSDDKLKEAEKMNIFLLALWLSCPTQTHVRFRFELPNEKDGSLSIARLLDRFQYNKEEVQDTLNIEHLNQARVYAESMKAIYIVQQRLWSSLVLAFYGCTTIQWQPAVICFSASVEGILTYEEGPGITKRLAKSFACLTQSTKSKRDAAYSAFIHSYNVRGNIMHGRVGNQKNGQKNLKDLAKWSGMLRNLWKIILDSPETITELEKPDADRKQWFMKREDKYQPPVL